MAASGQARGGFDANGESKCKDPLNRPREKQSTRHEEGLCANETGLGGLHQARKRGKKAGLNQKAGCRANGGASQKDVQPPKGSKSAVRNNRRLALELKEKS